MTLAEGQQADEVTDGHGLLDHRGQQPWRRHGDVDAPRLVEQPLVLGVVDPGHHPIDAELGLGQQRDDQVDLVVAGRGDHHVAALDVRLHQCVELAGVRQQPLRARHAVDLHGPWLPLDEQHLVTVAEELAGDGAPDVAGPGDRHPHQSLPGLGPLAQTAVTSSMRDQSTVKCTRSPSCTSVWPSGSRPSPRRVSRATRQPVASSNEGTLVPIHSGASAISASTTLPLGSRHSLSSPAG